MLNKSTKWIVGLTTAVLAYILLAYLVLPVLWRHYEHQPRLAFKPMVTHTGEGFSGDPLNIGLVGNLTDVMSAMNTIGWSRADPIDIKSGVEVAASVALDRPYKQAPVSNLYYEGRKEDIAFEKQIGGSPAQRHHVRFWKVLESGMEGRNVWLGSATLDRAIGFSKYTGQVTHHIASDIDTERSFLINDLAEARVVTTIYTVSGVGPTINGRNGEGDWYYTDGELEIAVITPGATTQATNPIRLDEPRSVAIKNSLWSIAQ
jgi:hypothetical protein